MEKDERGELAFAIHKQIEENEQKRRLLLAQNAQLLFKVFDEKYYKELLGDEEAEWAGYLGQLELFYSRNQVDTYRKIYQKLTTQLGIAPDIWVDVPITRLFDLLPIVDEENYAEWFAAALSLTKKDWNIELRKAKGLETEEDETHQHEDVLYAICRTCGRRHKMPHDTQATATGDTE